MTSGGNADVSVNLVGQTGFFFFGSASQFVSLQTVFFFFRCGALSCL